MTRILIVEDDRLVREWVEQVLSGEGYEVDRAKAGDEGMLRLAAAPPDLLILDLVMPQMSGFEVLSALEKKGIRIPTVITSGIVIPGVHDYLKTHPKVRILSKPYTSDQILEAIETLLDQPDPPNPKKA
jgi:CheY-like chemotaxis protein